MSQPQSIQCGRQVLDFSTPKIMGVLNITPDSFYAESRVTSIDSILQRAEMMLETGATILDVGGESTSKMVQRFGYGDQEQYVGGTASYTAGDSVACAQEAERVVPVVTALAERFDCVISVDTSSALVMKEVAAAGANMINDIRALERPGALAAAAETQLPVILMHSMVDHPEPGFQPYYDDLIGEVKAYWQTRVERCEEAGINRDKLILDPGFGGGLFGKNPTYDLQMLKHFDSFHELGLPLLAGMSRKSFIGAVLDKAPEGRLAGSLAAAMIALEKGAHILRVHDVAETKDVLTMVQALKAI